MSYDYDRYEDWTDRNKRYKAKRAKPGVHVPGKKEASILRRIKSETGMSEAEIREIPKYRKELSDAQKNPEAKPLKRKLIPGANPKWLGAKPSDNKFPVGAVIWKRLLKDASHADNYPPTDVWVVKKSKRIEDHINDRMYMEYWELYLEDFMDKNSYRDKEDSRRYEIVPDELVAKWKKQRTYKKFGL